jgi:hypothetical protein
MIPCAVYKNVAGYKTGDPVEPEFWINSPGMDEEGGWKWVRSLVYCLRCSAPGASNRAFRGMPCR